MATIPADTTIVDSYSVGRLNPEIKLRLSIGEMQISRSTVKINDEEAIEFDDSFEMPLGNANKIRGSKITIYTHISNIDKTKPGTTDFILEFMGGPKNYYNKKSKTVAAGGVVFYSADISFLSSDKIIRS